MSFSRGIKRDHTEEDLEDYQPFSSQILQTYQFKEIVKSALNDSGDIVYFVMFRNRKDETKTVICSKREMRDINKKVTSLKLD